MSNFKISILIPCYNQQDSIEEAIESALGQTYPFKEIVVADDSSSDQSLIRLQKYRNFQEVKIFQNHKNLGRVGNHRHLLYDLASGDYVVVLDGDDHFIDSDFITKAVEMAKANKLRLVFAEAEVEKSAGKVKCLSYPFSQSGVISYREIFAKGILFMHGAVLYRRDLALEYDFYSKEIIADDNESFLRFIVGEKVGFIKRPVYLYQWDNSPDRYPLKERLDNIEMVDSVYKFALEKCPQEKKLFNWWQERMLSTIFYGHLINLAYHQKYNQVREYVTAYTRKYGLARLLQSLCHPFVAYRWGGY